MNKGDTYNEFMKLISKGVKVRCSVTGQYFFFYETNDDGRGGRVAKAYDWRIHNQTKEKSKVTGEPDYFRGSNLFPIVQMSASQKQGLSTNYMVSPGQLYQTTDGPLLVTPKAV